MPKKSQGKDERYSVIQMTREEEAERSDEGMPSGEREAGAGWLHGQQGEADVRRGKHGISPHGNSSHLPRPQTVSTTYKHSATDAHFVTLSRIGRYEDHYEALGVSPSASTDAIKSAFRTLSRRWLAMCMKGPTADAQQGTTPM
eukprot:746704-Hanusia_phi.AAC.2